MAEVGALRAQVAQLTADRAALQAENARLRAHNEALARMVRAGGPGVGARVVGPVGGVVGQGLQADGQHHGLPPSASRRLVGVSVALAAADTAVMELEVRTPHPQ